MKPPEKRDAAAFLVAEHGLSKKRAAAAVRISRAALYRGPRQSPNDGDVVDALNGVVEKHPRWGFWGATGACGSTASRGITNASDACTGRCA